MSGYDVVRTGTFGTNVGGVSLGRGVARSDDSETQAKADAAAVKAATNVFGNVRINMAASNIGGIYKGNGPHATTGIPYAVSGQADVVSVDVTERLAAFSDPIKALLGTGVHESNTVIIKRQYVSGGGADIVPERAPARTVAIQEDTRQVELTRYGGDIEWNMNLLLRPADFQREMRMKLAAQEESLRAALIRIGYDEIMENGTDLVAALVKSNPAHTTDLKTAKDSAERIYIASVFGAMQKHPFAVENLLAAVRHASAYTLSSAPKTVMIIPQGLPELHAYSKPEKMNSFIRLNDQSDPVAAAVTGGSTTVSGVTVFQHVPFANNSMGAANFVSEGSLLANEVDIFMAVPYDANTQIVNPFTRSLVTLPDTSAQDVIIHWRLSMLSGIIGIPNGDGQNTGELLMSYPSTQVGTDVSSETGIMRLRMYLGAVLYRPENVMVLPDIAFNGCLGWAVYTTGEKGKVTSTKMSLDDLLTSGDGATTSAFTSGCFDENSNLSEYKDQGITCYSPSIYNDSELKTINNGHLGHVDSLDGIDQIYGMHVYKSTPTPLAVRQLGGAAP